MSQCCQRTVYGCVRGTISLASCRLFSSREQSSSPPDKHHSSHRLLELEAVHEAWRGAGYFPRAPPAVASHGANCLTTLFRHNLITKHVFEGLEYRLFPLTASFGNKEFDFGRIIQPKRCLISPEVSWNVGNLNADSRHTLVMVSPDCTSCSVHWCVSDIQHSETFTHDTSNDSERVTLLEYIPPLPLKGSGFYRYVLVLLQQNGPSPDNVSRSETLSALVSRCDLLPVGAAMFQACWDNSVGLSLATHLQSDEKQFRVQRVKDNAEHKAEELFLRKEWEMKTGFM